MRNGTAVIGLGVAIVAAGCEPAAGVDERQVVSNPVPAVDAAFAAEIEGIWSLFDVLTAIDSCKAGDAISRDHDDGVVVVAREVPGIGVPALQVDVRSCVLGEDCEDVQAGLVAGRDMPRPFTGTFNQQVDVFSLAGETVFPGQLDVELDICRFGRKYWSTLMKGAGGLAMEVTSVGIPPFAKEGDGTCALSKALAVVPERTRCDRYELGRLEPLPTE